MDRVVSCGLFIFASCKRFGTCKVVTARHPPLRFLLTEHNRIEDHSVLHFDTQQAPTALLQVIQRAPYFERFFLDRRGNKRRGHERCLAIQYQSAVYELGLLIGL